MKKQYKIVWIAIKLMLNDKINNYYRITYFLSFLAYLKWIYRPSSDANLSRIFA